MSKIKSFLESVTNNVCDQIRTALGNMEPVFYDIYAQVIQKEGVDLSTPEGRIKAFVTKVEANEELGTPAGRRIQSYVKAPQEFVSNAVTGKQKRGSKQGTQIVVFNVFDSGHTRGVFKELYGEIEDGKTAKIGDGLYELTEYAVAGRVVSPSWPEFFIYRNGNILKRRRKDYTGKILPEEDATATTRPMFLLAEELQGIETRIHNEARRMHFVNTTKPAIVDDSESAPAEEADVKTAKVKEETKTESTGTEG